MKTNAKQCRSETPSARSRKSHRHIQNKIGKTAQHCSFMWANGEKGCLNMGIFIPYYVH